MRGRRALGLGLVAASLGAGTAARAADPLNSRDRTSASASSSRPEGDTQVTVLPAAGGTTDLGFGVGEFAGITRVRRGIDPFVWNLESAGLVTFKPGDGGGVVVPYGDVYVQFVLPRAFGSASELSLRPAFTTETTLGYYGVGDATSDALPPGQSNAYFQYARTHPSMTADLRLRVHDHVIARTSLRYIHNWIDVHPGSKLAQDLSSRDPNVATFLGPVAPHGLAFFAYGVQWDDRDSEVSPHGGSFDDLTVQLSPGGEMPFPYRFAEVTADARTYLPLGTPRLTMALRVLGDVLVGDAPFYLLPRVDDDGVLGGPKGVRGVPLQRYAGKVKVLGSAELRADVASFRAFGKDLKLGLAAFFDAGRVWADLTSRPALDGDGLGLKLGVGGGARLQSGQAFLLRGDVAWSPDARPIGGYFQVGQAF